MRKHFIALLAGLPLVALGAALAQDETDPNTMSIETTVTDPDALTAPFTSTRTLKRHRSWTIAEYICEENNRNSVDANGKAGVNLANPGTQKRRD